MIASKDTVIVDAHGVPRKIFAGTPVPGQWEDAYEKATERPAHKPSRKQSNTDDEK